MTNLTSHRVVVPARHARPAAKTRHYRVLFDILVDTLTAASIMLQAFILVVLMMFDHTHPMVLGQAAALGLTLVAVFSVEWSRRRTRDMLARMNR